MKCYLQLLLQIFIARLAQGLRKYFPLALVTTSEIFEILRTESDVKPVVAKERKVSCLLIAVYHGNMQLYVSC